jgi:hypothetical protein
MEAMAKLLGRPPIAALSGPDRSGIAQRRLPIAPARNLPGNAVKSRQFCRTFYHETDSRVVVVLLSFCRIDVADSFLFHLAIECEDQVQH